MKKCALCGKDLESNEGLTIRVQRYYGHTGESKTEASTRVCERCWEKHLMKDEKINLVIISAGEKVAEYDGKNSIPEEYNGAMVKKALGRYAGGVTVELYI